MKRVKEFYVIISKDGKQFTGSSLTPYKLNSDQLSKVKGFESKKDAENALVEIPKYRKRYISEYEHNKKLQASYGNVNEVKGWENAINSEQRKLDAVEGGNVKKVVITWEVEP